MVFVLLYHLCDDGGHRSVLAEIGRVREDVGQFHCEAVIPHRVLYLLAALSLVRLFPDRKPFLELVACLCHHRTVDPHKLFLPKLLFRVQCGHLGIHILIGFLKELHIHFRQPCGDGATANRHPFCIIEECLELLAVEHCFDTSLAYPVRHAECIQKQMEHPFPA